jgi:hypothetical protein
VRRGGAVSDIMAPVLSVRSLCDGSWVAQCINSMVAGFSGRPNLELGINQSGRSWAAGGDIVVCGGILELGLDFYPGVLWGQDVFAPTFDQRQPAPICLAAGFASERMGDRAPGLKLIAPVGLA